LKEIGKKKMDKKGGKPSGEISTLEHTLLTNGPNRTKSCRR